MFHHRSSAKEQQKKAKATGQERRSNIKKINTAALSKEARLNASKQLRQAKREELLERKRLGGSDTRSSPPKVVALVAFHAQADPLSLKRRILASCGVSSAAMVAPQEQAVAALPNWAQGGPGSGKPRILLLDPPRDLLGVLDIAKCADVIVCVLGPHASLEEPSFDELGYRLLTALKAQGLPSIVGAIHGRDATMVSGKKAADARKFVNRYFTSELGDEARIFASNTDEEVKALVRAISGLVPKDLSWRYDRSYLLAQQAEYVSAEGVLCLRGYVRGPGFRCKHLTHLTGHGDFVLQRISVLNDPCPVERVHKDSASMKGCTSEERIVDELKQGEVPDTQRLQPYDPSTAEQTWPTTEELANAETSRRRGMGQIPAPAAKDVPIGDDDDSDLDDNDDDAMDQDDGDAADDGAASASDGETPSVAPSGMAETEDAWEVSSTMTMEPPSADAVASEKRRREVLLQRSQEELEFPDEVDTPLEVTARTRFQKYRGLKSFRTSSWDPYEDLPVEYSRIWEFESFGSTCRACRQQFSDDCDEVESGGLSALYCAVYLKGVQPEVLTSQPCGVPFVLSNVFPFEQKVSVVHGTLKRHKEYQEPLKSKQEISLHCGFRRFMARPVFSEIPKKSSTCKKFKFLRFLHEEVTACASFYAPVVFPPSRLLAFVHREGEQQLVASGSLTGVDPKQLIIKKILLTGYPFKTHKSKGVVRFMFFQPDDIRWFKPVELSTKKGLRGHITESLGTHGYMKCRFNGIIRQDDTVCMPLYKRVYPKWYPLSWGGSPEATPEDA